MLVATISDQHYGNEIHTSERWLLCRKMDQYSCQTGSFLSMELPYSDSQKKDLKADPPL